MSDHAFIRFSRIGFSHLPVIRSLVIFHVLFSLPVTASLLTAKQTKPSSNQTPHPSTVLVGGTVIDQNEKPVGGVTVKIRLRDKFEIKSTDERGQFAFRVPRNSLYNLLVLASSENKKLQSIVSFGSRVKKPDAKKLVLKLAPAREVRIHVNGSNGMVAPRVQVGVVSGTKLVTVGETDGKGLASLQIPQKLDNPLVFAFSPELGFDYGPLPSVDLGKNPAEESSKILKPLELALAKTRPVELQVNDINGKPVQQVPVAVSGIRKPDMKSVFRFSSIPELITAESNSQGKVRFAWMPDWRNALSFVAVSPRFTSYSARWTEDSGNSPVNLTVFRKFPVRGTVLKADGTPASGLSMRFHGKTSLPNTRRSSMDAAEAFTDDQGKFELFLAPSHFYMGFSQDPLLNFNKPIELYFADEKEIKEQSWTVRAGTRLFGQVIDKSTGKPVVNQNVTVTQFTSKVIVQPGQSGFYRAQPAYMRMAKTDENGRYEFRVGAGKFLIQDSNQNRPKSFTIDQQKKQEFNFALRRLEKGILTGKVINDETGQPIPNAFVHGIYSDELARSGRFRTKADKNGEFKVEKESVNTVLMARSEDSKWAVITKLDPDSKKVELRLKRTIAATGKLVDDKGNPLGNKDLIYGRDVYRGSRRSSFSISFGGLIQTNAKGEFKLENLVPGTTYQIRIVTKKEDGIPMSYRMVSEALPKIGSAKLDIGQITYREPVPYRPPTMEERIAKSFKADLKLQRLGSAEEIAKINRQNVLLVLGNPSDSRVKQLFRWKYEDMEIKKMLHGFILLGYEYHGGTDLKSVSKLAEKAGLKLGSMKREPLLVFLNDRGKAIEKLELSELAANKRDEIDKSNLIRVLTEHTPQPLDGEKLLADALALAKKENKRVIVQETATWCGPCIRLSRFLDRTKDDWRKDYIWIKMDHRWSKAPEIMRKMRNFAPGGVPWYAILDSSGKILATSNQEESEENIGFPSSQAGIAHFMKMITKSKIRLTDKQVEVWVKKLAEQ